LYNGRVSPLPEALSPYLEAKQALLKRLAEKYPPSKVAHHATVDTSLPPEETEIEEWLLQHFHIDPAPAPAPEKPANRTHPRLPPLPQ
jgi:hypothetical protein